MATFGQGINPQLGAIDYSPILKGSVAGAEMAAKGGSMIGQGIAALGEDAGKAVQQYYYNKDTKEMLGGVTNKIASIIDNDPWIANKLGLRKDPKTNTWDSKGIEIAVKTIGGGDVRKGVAMTAGLLSEHAAQQVQNSAFTNAIRPGVYLPGTETAAYSALGGENPMGMAQFIQGRDLNAANIAEKQAQAYHLKNPVVKSIQPTEYDKFTKNWIDDWKLKNPTKEVTASIRTLADQAWKTSNQPTVPDPVKSSMFNDLLAQRGPLQQSINSYNNNIVTQLLDSGQLFTGTGANAKLAGAKILKAAGFSNFDNEIQNTERLSALLVQPAIALAKQLGANPSDYDAKLLSKAQAGDIVYDDATIKLLNKARQDIIASSVKQHNQRIDAIYPANNPDYTQQRAAARLYGVDNNTDTSSGFSQLTPLSINAQKYLPKK